MSGRGVWCGHVVATATSIDLFLSIMAIGSYVVCSTET